MRRRCRLLAGCCQFSFRVCVRCPFPRLLPSPRHACPAARDGVIIATEKKVPSILVDETSFERLVMLSDNIGVIYSGMGPDFRVLVRKGQKKAIEYFMTYKVRT